MNLILAFCGFTVGTWSSLTGMGPAPILSPLLAWLIGLRDRRLSSVILLATMTISLLGLLAYVQTHAVSFPAAVIVAVSSILGALIGALPALNPLRESRAAIAFWACVALATGCWLMYAAAPIAGPSTRNFLTTLPLFHNTWLTWFVSGLTAGLIGRLSNLAGAATVPVLLLFADTTPVVAQATSLAVLAIVSIVPAANYLSSNEAPPSPTLWTTFGGALGALTGARAAVAIAPPVLVLIYGAGLFLLGFYRLFQAWPHIAYAAHDKAP